jgi:ABC-type nitrate/sulfonate/bicarbonate transport system substrate-binding protein
MTFDRAQGGRLSIGTNAQGVKMALFLTVLLGLIFLFPPSLYSQARALKRIRVGVPSVSMGNIIIFITKEARLYEKHGLDAEVITMNGSGIASKALISGNIEISPIATPTVINANLAGSDMAILAHTMPGVVHALMVKPEIKKPEDLKGKKVAVSSLGSLTDFLVRYIARKKGLNPDRDVTLIVSWR